MTAIGRTPPSELALAALELSRRWRRVYRRVETDGLEPLEMEVLLAILAHPLRTVAELAAVLEVARSSVSNAVTRLRRGRLVAVHHDPDDGRVRRLEATPAGVDAVEAFLRQAGPHLGAH